MKSKILRIVLLNLIVAPYLLAQNPDLTPWQTDPYGNGWIDYTKTYVRVGIPEDGVYKVEFASLADKLPTISSTNFEIWNRGRQVVPLEITDSYVIFWGRRNDGASDGLLFLSPEDRTDKTTSFFSEEGSYFFTTGSPGNRQEVDGSLNGDNPTEAFHTETIIENHSKFDADGKRQFNASVNPEKYRYISFAFDADGNQSVTDPTNYSLYDRHNAYVTTIGSHSGVPNQLKEFFTLENFAVGGPTPTVEYAIHGVSRLQTHRVEIHASDDDASLLTDLKRLSDRTFQNHQSFVELKELIPDVHFNSTTGEGILSFKTFYDNIEIYNERFGISYYKITYPQQLIYNGTKFKKFFFTDTAVAGRRRISIADAPENPLVYDLTDVYNPKKITNFQFNGGQLTFEVDRTEGQELVILVTDANGSETADTIYAVDFSPVATHTNTNVYLEGSKLNPNAFDLLMVTHDDPSRPVLDGAIDYFNYRTSPVGGNHRTLLITMRNIYDQFNFGEPSPIAIRRFVDYMLSGNPKIRPEHALFLIGHAVTFPVRVVKELRYEVPTIGDPGSDGLLVSYLTNSPHADPNIPAIPVGRITAFNSNQVNAYLDKVKMYETQTRSGSPEDLKWRKKGLQLIGAKQHNPIGYSEIYDFRNKFLQAESKMVNHLAEYPWEVVTKDNELLSFKNGVTQNENRVNAIPDIKDDIEEGIGFFTYFGHGNVIGPLYNFNTASNYTITNGRYPFMYITGCGIGNFYTAETNISVANSWIIEANRGAIAMISNSFDAYANIAAVYMNILYSHIFGKPDYQRNTIGHIWRAAAEEFLAGNPGGRMMYDGRELSHVHQTNLMGDPLLNILNINEQTLPVELSEFRGFPYENSSVFLEWVTRSETNNSHFEIERSADGVTFEQIGRVEGKGDGDQVQVYSFIDRNPKIGINFYRLKQFDLGEGNFEYSNIISVEVDGALSVYPNPATDVVKLTSERGNSSYHWTVFSVTGARVMDGTGNELSVKNLPAGVYIIELKDEHDVVVRKRILKR